MLNLEFGLNHFVLEKWNARRNYQLLVVWNARQKVQDFVVGDAVRPEELSGELVDSPAENEIAQRHQVEQQASGRQQHNGQVR